MKPGRRIVLSAVMAVLVVASIAGLAALRDKPTSGRVATQGEVATVPSPATIPERSAAPTSPVPAAVMAASPAERPIEDVLAESGEDPGAVFYMSRVREALREGNPAFAGELLRQMKREHTKSVLVEEAEALLAKEKGER